MEPVQLQHRDSLLLGEQAIGIDVPSLRVSEQGTDEHVVLVGSASLGDDQSLGRRLAVDLERADIASPSAVEEALGQPLDEMVGLSEQGEDGRAYPESKLSSATERDDRHPRRGGRRSDRAIKRSTDQLVN